METMRGRVAGMVDLDVRLNELTDNFSAHISLTTTWQDIDGYHAYKTDAIHLEVRKVMLEAMSTASDDRLHDS